MTIRNIIEARYHDPAKHKDSPCESRELAVVSENNGMNHDVYLEIDNKRYSVSAYELLWAIKNCTLTYFKGYIQRLTE